MVDHAPLGQEPVALSQVLDFAGRRCWVLRGRLLPLMAGAEDPPTPSPAPADPPPADPPTPPAPTPEPTSFDREYVEQLRKEAAANRKKAADYEAKLKAHEDAQLSEQERTTKQLAEAQAELAQLRQDRQALIVRHVVEREAQGLGFRDPADAHLFVSTEGLADLDEAALPKQVRQRLEALLKDKDYLRAATNGHAAVPATPRPAGAPNPEQVINEKADTLRRTGAYGRF